MIETIQKTFSMTLLATYSLSCLVKLRYSLFYQTCEIPSMNLAIKLTNLIAQITLSD